jgi:hypothetical protein
MDPHEEIVRNPDGTLTVPVQPQRADDSTAPDEDAPSGPQTITLHPGEGGYDEALSEWDLQQDPDRGAAVSTASGRDEARAAVHTVAVDPDAEVSDVVAHLEDPEASAEALRHVLVGGVPSVEGFASEVAESEGDEPIPAHKVTKIIGEVLAEIDT